MTPHDRRLLNQSTSRVEDWLGSRDTVSLNPELIAHLATADPAYLRKLEQMPSRHENNLTALMDDEEFRDVIRLLSDGKNTFGPSGGPFAGASAPDDAFAAWANLSRHKQYHGAIWVIELPKPTPNSLDSS